MENCKGDILLGTGCGICPKCQEIINEFQRRISFEEDLTQTIKKKIIADIKKIEFTQIRYNEKKPLPEEFLNKAWAQVDWDKVLVDVKESMEVRICNSIVASMETELKTDVKKLLSIDGVRQKLRMEIYPQLMKVLNDDN